MPLAAPLLLVARAAIGARAAAATPPPIPEPGPLAEPRSLNQIGAPADQTRAAIPPDNPQTPEKVTSEPYEAICRLTSVRPR